jgi:spore germination protein GerM
MAQRKSPAKKNTPFQRKKSGGKPWGIIFWAAFFVIVVGLFTLNRDRIRSTLDETHFFDQFMDRTATPGIERPPGVFSPEGTEPETPAGQDPAETKPPEQVPSGQTPAEQIAPPPIEHTEQKPAEKAPEQKAPEPKPAEKEQPPAGTAGSPPAASGENRLTVTPARRERALYFISIDADGAVLRVKVTRDLPVSDSPMVDALNVLLAGPDVDEQAWGLVSLIPPETRVLSATVRGSTAYISFSEDLQYNIYGVEGYAGALRQILWTATEFSNVKDVQILIEGRRVDYLGEGIWIGSPLGRDTPF